VTSASRETFDPDHVRDIVPGFHWGVKHRGFIFLAGQVGLDKNLEVVDGLEAQTRQALENIREVLALAGSGPADIIQLMIFYKHTPGLVLSDAVQEFVQVKNDVLPGSAPVGFACSVHELLDPAFLVEVQAVAVTDE
jgi:enamine deaminase RidA (YjgF/YER057c/UK114 family)